MSIELVEALLLIEAIDRIATGEDQVAQDDSEGLGCIHTLIKKFGEGD